MDRVREVYERAIAQVPPAQEKRLWRRYIYLWIKYALFEELETKVRRSASPMTPDIETAWMTTTARTFVLLIRCVLVFTTGLRAH